jgi:glycosyltransferase involved in cell wall biosynthesis
VESKISVIIPSYNTPRESLTKLYDSLISQSHRNFEAILVDDCSNHPYGHLLQDERFRVIYRKHHSGPATCRNIGVENASSDYIFFTDSDCELETHTLEIIIQHLEQEELLMGNTITKAKSFFGKAVACLGFPGGGSIGFDQVWKVDRAGYTNSISSCNFALKRRVFDDLGRFDTTFPVPGGEDTVFAKEAIKKGYRIKYVPFQIVFHVERKGLKNFIYWQIVRGRGNYHIKKKLGKVKGFLWLRLWSFKNSLLRSGVFYAPAVIFLFILSVLYQTKGYRMEKRNQKSKA